MLTTLEYAPDENPQKIAEDVRTVWSRSKVIHIRGPKPEQDLRDYYWGLMQELGDPQPLAEDAQLGDRDAQRSGSYWAEVRYDPSLPLGYRHSANAQPLHTDSAYISTTGLDHEVSPNAVGTGFLACVAMPDNGGATVFIDAEDLVSSLREEDPELLAKLEQTDVPHARSGDRRVERIIRYKDNGQPLVNWNYYCVDTEAGDEVQQLRERFFHFLQTSPGVAAAIKRVKLSPGEVVMWKDEQLLHGRDAFDPEKPSDRFLWKTGLMIDA